MKCWPILLACVASAQSVPDVTLTLAAKDGQTRFQQGEPIELELRFETSKPLQYGVWDRNAERLARIAKYDEFAVEPTDGGVDPLANGPEVGGEVFVGPPPAPVAIDSDGAAVTLFLNEWYSFRKPGHYRVSLTTTRAVAMSKPYAETGRPLRSNSFEFDVVPADPAWAAAQLQRAIARFDTPYPRAPTSTFQQVKAAEENARYAGRMVRFMETPEAVRVLAEYIGRAPEYAESQLRMAARTTPFRKELIADMREVAGSADLPITQDVYAGLQSYAREAAFGPEPALPADSSAIHQWLQEDKQYRERSQPAADAVTAEMVADLAHKTGSALAISLATLSASGPSAPPPELRKALVANFAALPLLQQHNWLAMNWPRIAAPDTEPMLRTLASGTGDLRDVALVRLAEFNPEAARVIALDRIRRNDTYRLAHDNDRNLLTLPDATLPELDDALATHFEQGLWHADLLLARYGSRAIEPRVKAYVEKNDVCNGMSMAYFFRVDPGYARTRRCTPDGLQPFVDLLMSPALEQQLIADASGASGNAIVQLLVDTGSETSRQTVLDRGLVIAAGWIPTDADFATARAACDSDHCRDHIDSVRGQLAGPIAISPDGTIDTIGNYATVGPFGLRSAKALKAKIAQFPIGTSFYVATAYPGTWWADERTGEIGEMVRDAGMKLVDPPH